MYIRHDRVTLAPAGTKVGDNTATVRLGPFYNDGYSAMRISIERQGQTGAAVTFDAKPQWRHIDGGSWLDMTDHGGAVIAFEQWATTDTGVKHLDIGRGILSGDADDKITADAAAPESRFYNAFIPFEMSILVTQTQAAGKDNSFNCTVELQS